MEIELVMFPVEHSRRTFSWFPYIQFHKKRGWWPLFLRQRFMNSRTTWDDIHVWVAQGYTVVIRPPTEAERIEAQPELDKCYALSPDS